MEKKEKNAEITKEKKEESSLEKLKKKYGELQKKYKLPTFEKMNYYYDIEELSGKETDLLLRAVRRKITEKTNSYLRFIEVFLNPSQAPLFFMLLGKSLDAETMKLMNEIYIELGKVEIEHLRLEVQESEAEEARVINEVTKNWEIIREKTKGLAEIFGKRWNKKSESKEKGYFG
ncbi:hypothetical protein COU61_03055 [Candidatus Pacearchaeota archaeon CG10_big_fil_rev_8_21_14_0_10_35_13]|nr:MAG: hypothetical protein COU61_03055 [Candidatus Pacearchaeota archaeon CG10_big_fil_rev_8_21_14_0_10_35_13]